MMDKKMLRQRCKQEGIKNYYKLTKYELIALLNSEFIEELYNPKEQQEQPKEQQEHPKEQQEQQEHPKEQQEQQEHPEDYSEENLDEFLIQENYYETKKV